MNGIKKLIVRILIICYGISYLLQNAIFVDRKKVYAAENPSTTNLVAVFVDKNIYQDIKNNLERYTTQYLQKKIANSKAVVFPIDTATLKAHEISQMLENMYFEGLKDQSSKLVGTILIGDVPLPVVENNGFIYPSIYPYVDFEHQQFIYDANKRFFVYNDIPNGQAELRHGIIKFDKGSEYNKFFEKVRSYYNNPTTFIDKAIRYDDFIGTKKYFIPENTKYYINSMIFAEDIGYHRFNNLLLNALQGEHNESALAVGDDLASDMQDVTDPDLKAYADDMQSRNSEAAAMSQEVSSSMPTLTLKKSIQEMVKGYDGLVSSQFLSKIKDNINGLARRYKTTEGETFTDYSSLTDKIAQKDNRLLGDADNNIQPLLIQMNDYLESGLNAKIQEEKYYMTIPIPVSELEFEGDMKFTLGVTPKRVCVRKTYNYFENYYFGKNVDKLVSSAEDTSIYRGTYQNLSSISGQSITKPIQSIGGSYNLFSTQVEANRGYNINSTQEELKLYATTKINKQSLRNKECNLHLFGYCIRRKKKRKADDSADEDKCYTGDIEKQGGCESLEAFSQRNRGGASPMNIDSTTQRLKNFNYKDAIFPIYDIAGSKKISAAQADANSYKGVNTYAALIQQRIGLGQRQEGSYDSVDDLINNPQGKGIDLKFTNQIPSNTDLEHPVRTYNPPKTYTDFFSLFGTSGLPYYKISGGKAILYDRTPANDAKNCNMKGQIYTYKTIDSRVKNISPTRNQISDTEFYKFKDGADLEIFHTDVMTDLSETKADIVKKNEEFSGADSMDVTGTVANLAQIRNIVVSGNASMQEIATFMPISLLNMNATEYNALVSRRTERNFNPEKITEISGRVQKVNAGLDSLLDYVNSLSINNTVLSFQKISQSEGFKKQKVEILDTRKAQFNQNFDYITANVNGLKSTFSNARGIYNTIGQLNNKILEVVAQKEAIRLLALCGEPPLPCGCDANHYKAACDVLDNLINVLQTNAISETNDRLDKIQEYEGENSQMVKPFEEINLAFTPPNIFGEITDVKTVMNGFDVSSDPEKKEINKGMNLTTSDRPIDNIRNITFKGIGGDVVRFNYPNLYEVGVYKEVGGKLVLKTLTEIRDAVKTYLTNKTKEYNTLLVAQTEKRNNGYYSGLKAQFDFLGQLDPLANPNTHDYDLLPDSYFIDQLVAFLNTLEDGYGRTAVYGKVVPGNADEKLDLIAKVLYYQNITRPERVQQNTVTEDMTEIKDSFDVNQKISDVASTYLAEGNDQGKFITPLYNSTGYEIGYINSDGEDYISSKPTPALIQQIQTVQEKSASTTKPIANQFIETPESTSSSAQLQAQVDSCEGVDTDGTSLLFDFKTFKSPWIKAMGCRAKQVRKKPFDIKIGFKNSLGPVALGSLKELGNTIENRTGDRKEFGAQRSAPNNDDVIAQAPSDIQEKLQGYNTYAIVNIDKKIIGVDDVGNAQIKIGMTQDVGEVNVKISGTGDNCFAIQRNGRTLSENICTRSAKEYYNPNTEEYIFDIVLNQNHKAGTTALKIELCPAQGTSCITKQQVMNILPGPIDKISLQSPDKGNILMEGGEVPLIVSAIDSYGNNIGQSIQAYTISVNSGDGKIYDGASANSSIKFSNFAQSAFIYQAPTGLKENKGITITIAPDLTQAKLLTNEPVTVPKVAQKTITVVQGIVTVSKNNVILYKTNTPQLIQPSISYTLLKDEADIQYMDEDGIAQIKPENIPSLVISITDKNKSILNTVANITSKNGLLSPGTVKENIIENKKQIIFSKSNDFITTDGKLDIALYPSFKAGNDVITINIPGIDPIDIPVTVNAGPAKTVFMKLEKSRLDLTATTTSKGTINVVDTRNNKVTKPTTIKLGVIGAAESRISEFMYSGKEFTYTITAKKPGGEGYVFAYIKDRTLSDQVPAYERFIVQESVLPKEKLNIMYLNLFGTDRGNQRGYFSENDKAVNSMTSQSNKLIATTTELVDPSKIKQIEYIISPHGQIQSINTKISTLTIENKAFIVLMPEIAKIHLGASSNFEIKTYADSGAVNAFAKDSNTLLYIPEPKDSVITGNEATKSKITINGIDVIDLVKGTMDPAIIITADDETIADMSVYTITYNEKVIGKLMIRNKDDITANAANIDLQDPITYGKTTVFSEGSTNTEGVGIYVVASAFAKQGYASIEDSSDGMLGIGFTSNFKNVSNFANGKSVGEATLPYGSQFLINFGDPLLERRDKNPNIPDTDFDASIGQTIYADPTKTIFKVLPMDFNNDGVKDLLVVYTDGVIKLLKNYGGTAPYKDLQELMIIAEPIKEIHIGDVDGNGYEDIFITTSNNKGIVYLNEKGIFAVDGKNVCLNVNAEPGATNPAPEDFSNINQMFVEDMDKDGKLDIVTNDSFSDIKVFYGGGNSAGANYLSSVSGMCDANRYARQKDNYKIIKRFGTKVNSSRYIQDASLIHRKGAEIPVEGVEEEVDENAPDTTSGMTEDDMKKLKDKAMSDIKTMVANTDTYVAAGSAQLAYTDNPLSTAPVYELLPADEITYLPISETNNAVSVYKEYVDINGGVLRQDDEVVIKTTIISKKSNNKLTYIDQLQGPRSIAKDGNNKITSLIFTAGATGGIIIDRNGPEGYQFVMDNIQLASGAMLSFSYKVKYLAQTPTIKIDVQDQDLLKENKNKDEYPDITINSTDACQKNRWIFFNDKTGKKKTYEQIFDDIQTEINDYNSGAAAGAENTISDLVDNLANMSDLEDVSSLPGMDTLEPRSPRNLLNTLTGGGGNISTNFIDSATSKVSKKMDTILEGLCQGFTIGKGGCQGVPVPFNQAFLAPGDYHIFGCVPKAPNPLYPIFKTLNNTIGKGMPLLTIPGNRPYAGAYLPIPGIFGYPFKGPTDGFFLGIQGGTYPSQFRLYIAPTLTLGLGIAMCFGPYSVGKALPKPFRDLGGNCIVFALPPLTKCSSGGGTGTANQPSTESLGSSMVAAAGQGTCNNPPKIGNTIVFAEDKEVAASTASSPFQIVAAGSDENNPKYSAAIPQGNFGGLVQMDQDPIRVSAAEDYGNANEQLYEGYELNKGEKINLKILGGKTKGLVKCVIQDRTTRQIQYIQNNLTKMTIQVDLPDLTTAFQGFDKIGNLVETYKTINKFDAQAGYLQTGSVLSRQQINSISQQIGQNPFEAIQQMFNEVPLVNIDTQTVNIKVPALTSDDIKKYQNYLKLRVEKADKILQDRDEFFASVIPMCSTKEMKEQIKNGKNITKQVNDLEGIQNNGKLSKEQETELASLKTAQKQVELCLKVANQSRQFITFRTNSAGLIRSIKENINVLEKYKEFPGQLYQRTHLTDRYLTELSSLLSDFVGSTTYRLNTNATRFSQYVDALTLLVGSIKTRQAIIDFSVNWSEKCSKCSNDNYGSFSCSLSFLCPKLPIFPIPAFKIPNIYMDMSHIELGMNIILPKINFVPVKVALPQIPNLPEPPTIEVNWDILLGLDINFFKDMSLPTIPVMPEPPTLPEPPSFIPSIKMDLPVLPPAPKIPKILPEINGVLKVAKFIGKIFCIVKGGIGLVGEKGVKGKIEQITQRTWNVPVFDYFNLTTKYKDPPLQGFDYKMDAYTTLKFNFDGVYDVFNNIAQITNGIVSQAVEAPIQKAVDRTTENANNNPVVSGFEFIENLDQNININYIERHNEKLSSLGGETFHDVELILTSRQYLQPGTGEMMEYATAYNQLKQGLISFKNETLTDKTMNDRVKTILATVENRSTILPATSQIQQVEKAAQGIIEKNIKENQILQKEVSEYDEFIKKLQNNPIALVDDKTLSVSLKTPILTIDSPTKNILQSQEDPTKTYLSLNKRMVQGYLDAVNNDGPEKLNMTTATYKKSKKYLETTKEKIDTALLAYSDKPLLAQGTGGCTNCSSAESDYSADISAYVNGIFVESYSGNEKNMINTVSSSQQVQNVQKSYTTNTDLNNDRNTDILMYDANTIYVKYAKQESEHFSRGNNELTIYYDKFYSYASEHPGNIFNASSRYIASLEQVRNNSDAYGYMTINDITVKVIEKNKEVKNLKTEGQTFDALQLSWKNSKVLGETVDGYLIKVSNKIDNKDMLSSFRDFLGTTEKSKYIVVLPNDTDYKKGLITIDKDIVKNPINLELGDNILAVEYYDPIQDKISVTLKDLPRKRLYTNIATLTSAPEDLSSSQKKNFTLYKKSSSRSNQTVAGMQNLGDITAPVGEIVLWRNTTSETVSTGVAHEGYINTLYTLKSVWTDNVVVAKMIIQKDGKTIFEKDNQSQTGRIEVGGLFFTGTAQQSFDFIAIDQNNNIAKETVTLNIKIPEIEIIDLKKSGESTADVIARISNDLDEGMIVFQRLRNGARNNISGSNQNALGGFDLSPKQTLITGGIFTIGNTIGLYDNQGNEIATIDPKTGEIRINQGFENKVKLNLSFTTHIPVIELRDIVKNITLFQIVLPVESITAIQMNQGKPNYEQIQLPDGQFGDFNNGYCIKNAKSDCILYTNAAGAIYIPGMYASSLLGEYIFDKTTKNTTFVVKDQSGKAITTLTLKIRETK